MEWNFGDVFLSMLVFFFWVVFISMFISAFVDIFRRHDLSGWAKAAWTLLILVLPIIGVLVYIVARPKVLYEDTYLTGGYAGSRGYYSSAEEIARLAGLHEKGTISREEYDRLRNRTIA